MPHQNYSEQKLRGRSFRGRDLTGADFSGADLRGADFRGAILTGAKFCGARMGISRKRAVAKFFLGLVAGVLSGLLITI
ncbi:MAG: pentapeptide repeat-containing protein [Gammaproteobacteria bacterium]